MTFNFIHLALYSDKGRSFSKLLMPTHNHLIMVMGTALKYTHTPPAPKSAGHDNIPGCHCRRVQQCFAFGRSRFRSAVKRLAMFGLLFVFSAPQFSDGQDTFPFISQTRRYNPCCYETNDTEMYPCWYFLQAEDLVRAWSHEKGKKETKELQFTSRWNQQTRKDMGVDKKNLDTPRTAVPLMYRQHNLVFSAQTSEMHKVQQAEPPGTQELRYHPQCPEWQMLETSCRRCLAYKMRLSVVGVKGREC